jgi:CrcB protein
MNGVDWLSLPMLVLLAGLGALGALLRFGVFLFVKHTATSEFPFATLVVNVIGCFLLGCATAAWPVFSWRWAMAAMVLGAFTTFSTFQTDALMLWRTGRKRWFWYYVSWNVGGGLALFSALPFIINH